MTEGTQPSNATPTADESGAFRLQRRPRARTEFYLEDRPDSGVFTTQNHSLGLLDIATGRLVLAETTCGVFRESLFYREGDSAHQIRSNDIAAFLTERIAGLASRSPAAVPGCDVYVSADDNWRTLPVSHNLDVLVVGEVAEDFEGADPASMHIVFALTDRRDHSITVEYWPAAAHSYSLEACIDSVLHALQTLEWSDIERLLITPQLRTLVPESITLDDAVSRTLQVSRSLLTPPSGDVDGREEAAQLIQQLLMDPWDEDRPSWFARTSRPDFDLMIQMRQGNSMAAVLAAEHFVSRACRAAATGHDETSELSSEARGFADALTSYLRAHVGTNAMNAQRLTSRICNLMFEWITQKTARRYQLRLGVDARKLSPIALNRLDCLVRFAPWLEFFVEARPKGHLLKIVLSHDDLVKTLALVRPRNTYVRISGRPGVRGSFREKFVDINPVVMTIHYVLPEDVVESLETAPWFMNDLARTCEKLFFLPSDARRAVQVLGTVSQISELIHQYARVAETDRAGIGDIAILMDYPPNLDPRPVVVNTSPSSRAFVELGGIQSELAEFTLDFERATKFSTSPLWLGDIDNASSIQLTVGDAATQVPIQVRSSKSRGSMCHTQWIDVDLFRGRRDQLIRLSGIMRPDVDLRQPVAIFGPRRAGKTTLAVHACRRAVQIGALSNFCVIDMYIDVDGTRPAGYTQRFADLLVQNASAKLGFAVDISAADPVDVLRQLDDMLDGAQPFGIVLDEFDTLLTAEPASELRRLAVRLGKLRWKNLVLIATVQRFHRSSSDLETWEFVECRADLTWRDGLTYFCPPLIECETGRRDVIELNAPVALPHLFRDVISERIGYRPYLWGRLRFELEGYFVADDGYAVVDRDLIHHVLDIFVTADPFLALPLHSTVGMSIGECRRRDLFSEGERRILAYFASEGRKGMPVEEASAVGTAEAVSELLDRGYMRKEGKQLAIAVPIFSEFLQAHAGDFDLEAEHR